MEEANARFARAVYSSRASLLIIGDSTNVAGGAGLYVPYYEGFVQTIPSDIQLCGFRVSGSFGNTGVNNYIRFSGASDSQMVAGHLLGMQPDTPVATTNHAPPGLRWQFQIIPNGSLSSTGGARFAAVGLTNLEGIYPNAASWGQGETLVIRTPFYVSDDGSMLGSISMSLLSDHDGSAGLSVALFDASPRVDVVFGSNHIGMEMVDAVFKQTPTTRIGVRFSGDLDTNDANEAGKTVAWCSHILFNQRLATLNHGLYLDSISLSGYTARDHFETLDPITLDDYFLATPRPYSTIMIWLGQNAEPDEWNGTLSQAWSDRIEAIGDLAIQAAIDAGYTQLPTPILVTPPNARSSYPSPRFSAMNNALDEIARRRGWGHIDLQTLIGSSLFSIDPGFLGIGVHPSESGSLFVTQLIYDHLDCLRAEFTGDTIRDFFDVSAFLSLFALQDPQADLNGDGDFNFFDISTFLQAFNGNCP